jgi:hypothetical protein
MDDVETAPLIAEHLPFFVKEGVEGILRGFLQGGPHLRQSTASLLGLSALLIWLNLNMD